MGDELKYGPGTKLKFKQNIYYVPAQVWDCDGGDNIEHVFFKKGEIVTVGWANGGYMFIKTSEGDFEYYDFGDYYLEEVQ